jgi:uncharacterized small protein (DUF1192 family)
MADNSARIAELKAKLKASENKPGLTQRVASLKAEIAKLEAENGD